MDNFSQTVKILWDYFDFLIYVVGFVVSSLFVIGGFVTLIAWARGVARPLWRLGIGLSRREIWIVASTENCNSLSELLRKSTLFNSKNIRYLTTANDVKDLSCANLILFQWSNSPVAIDEVLKHKKPQAALVIYAKPGEIKDWNVLDEHRNISVTNLRGRLLTDLINALMTTGYDKK